MEQSNTVREAGAPGPGQEFEIIQQWQYMGNVQPGLLTDAAMENCKKIGITSLQSYVTWAEIEKIECTLDFSAYDPLVEALLKHRLKWVPFLILGPYYATPEWFRKSPRSLYAKCLEHGRESKIQSIWNPHLPRCVEHFLHVFSEHYGDANLFESICLGISGNWGEAIYPATGCFLGGFHVHPGWWCGDRYAIESFRRHCVRKYASLEHLNMQWGTNFSDCSDVGFPQLSHSLIKDLYFEAVKRMPYSFKPPLKKMKSALTDITTSFMGPKRQSGRAQEDLWGARERRTIDFVEWYQGSMTAWAEFWLKTARKCFPRSRIYLVTGGEGESCLGADFAAQAAVAARYGGGIRITNQSDDFGESFVRARLLASASRHYGAYLTTEEAGINKPEGVTVRAFEALASGANGLYCKSLIGVGRDLCTGRYLPCGEVSGGGTNLSRVRHCLVPSQPVLDVAVLFPNASIGVKPSLLSVLYGHGAKLRGWVDFDFVDESMVRDSCLQKYGFLIALAGHLLQPDVVTEIADWIGRGGVFVSSAHLPVTSVVCDAAPVGITTTLPDGRGIMKSIHGGHMLTFEGERGDYLRFISEAVFNSGKRYPWNGVPGILNGHGRQYLTRFSDKVIDYNPATSRMRIHSLREEDGAGDGSRTRDLLITNQLLYH